MKTTKKLCLALIVCAFGAGYTAVLKRPQPAAVMVTYYCQPGFQPCYFPVASIARLMP